jgi:hypothetical protein
LNDGRREGLALSSLYDDVRSDYRRKTKIITVNTEINIY